MRARLARYVGADFLDGFVVGILFSAAVIVGWVVIVEAIG